MFRRIQVSQEIKKAVGFIKKINAKKMLLVAGLSLLGVFAVGQSANAAPTIEQKYRKTNETGYTTYHLELKDDAGINKVYKTSRERVSNPGITNATLSQQSGVYKIEGTEVSQANPDADADEDDREVIRIHEITGDDRIIWEESNGGKEVLAVVKVESDVKLLVVESNALADQYGELSVTGNGAPTSSEDRDNNGPEAVDGTLIKYNSDEYGSYIQGVFHDKTKIWKIKDASGNEKVLLKEKQDDNYVTVKYMLKEGETSFKIYDVLGNESTINMSDANIQVEFNAKDLEGTRAAFKVNNEYTTGTGSNEKTFKLTGIKTGAGETVALQDNNNIYQHSATVDSIPKGTTKLVLTYKVPDGNGGYLETEGNIATYTIPLLLDKTNPEGVRYTKDEDTVEYSYEVNGETKNGNYKKYTVTKVEGDIKDLSKGSLAGTVRAYVNNTTKKCIVEVRDIQSGIDKIELLKGTTGNYSVVSGNAGNYDSNGDLRASVLHLFDFKNATFGENEEARAVRITDGIGHKTDVPIETSNTIATAELVEERDNAGNVSYKVVAQDYKAGLLKIVRGEEVLAGFEDASQLTVGNAQVSGSKVGNEYVYTNGSVKVTIDGGVYEQYTLNMVTRSVDQNGNPTITIYDALGNEKTVSFDDLAFVCIYATYNEENALAVNIKETRGIWKITALIDNDESDQKPTDTEAQGYADDLAAWETRHTYTLEVFHENHEPTKLIKTYQVPKGTIEKVTVYNTRGEDGAKNDIVAQGQGNDKEGLVSVGDKLADIKEAIEESENIPAALEKLINVTPDDLEVNGGEVTGATVRAPHGIKKVEYYDGTLIEFRKDLPTDLFIDCSMITLGTDDHVKATVVDATGCNITIQDTKVSLDYLDMANTYDATNEAANHSALQVSIDELKVVSKQS